MGAVTRYSSSFDDMITSIDVKAKNM